MRVKYIGLDVHQARAVAAVLDAHGKLVMESDLLKLSKPLDWRVRQPWFYRRLQAYGFFWLCEGHSVVTETWCRSTVCLSPYGILSLEPESFADRPSFSTATRVITQYLSLRFLVPMNSALHALDAEYLMFIVFFLKFWFRKFLRAR